ncbi:MAG TPA: response regulator [Gemmatimonadales bacterium]|nr:response regulator [Gemmatimonadales bacterium]
MADPKPVVLLIEDEPQMRRFLRTALEPHGYGLVEAETAREGMGHATAHNPDVILLDLGLPDMDGLEVTRRIREWSRVPIIVLSARGQETDKVAALDAGADDYVTKPFAVGELLARMRVALRHAREADGGSAEPVLTVGDLRVDLAARRVDLGGTEIHLTPTEYRLLAVLMRHAGRVVTHRQLLKEVWGVNAIQHTHYLRVYMTQLRHKIERDPARPEYFTTELGVGYRLRAE